MSPDNNVDKGRKNMGGRPSRSRRPDASLPPRYHRVDWGKGSIPWRLDPRAGCLRADAEELIRDGTGYDSILFLPDERTYMNGRDRRSTAYGEKLSVVPRPDPLREK